METRDGRDFHGRLYLALQRLRGRPVGPLIRRLQSWERLEPSAFQGIIRARTREALRYARDWVPLYSQEPWRTALSRGDPLDPLSWPVLERKLLVTDRSQLLARRKIPGRFYRQSSASTGEPVKVDYSPLAAAWSWANEYRAMLWFGVAPGSRTLMMWGGAHPVLDWIRNCRIVLTTNLTSARLEEAAQYVLERKPSLCMGLPSALTLLAGHIRRHHPEARLPVVPVVKLGGEQVYAFQREEIARSLGARVVESYGCTEVGAIAGECPAGSLHIFAEHVRLEILAGGEPAAPGEVGDIVVTSLTNRAMPLVRCRIGDRGSISPSGCRCGLPHPVLENLVGRSADLLLTSDGRPVHGSALGERLRSFVAGPRPDVVGQVLFHQQDATNWKVLVERGPRFDDQSAASLREVVQSIFGRECRVEIEFVPVVPREPSGKFRYYRLAPPAAHAGHMST